jgi:hypothetical protein
VGAHLGTALGAPVSDPASVEHPPETRRIGDRRSAIAAKSGAVSRCARTVIADSVMIDFLGLFFYLLWLDGKARTMWLKRGVPHHLFSTETSVLW